MGIEGELRHKAVNTVVLSNVLQIVMFSIFMQVALDLEKGRGLVFWKIASAMAKEVSLAIILGFVMFVVLKLIVKDTPSRRKARSRRGKDWFWIPTVCF